MDERRGIIAGLLQRAEDLWFLMLLAGALVALARWKDANPSMPAREALGRGVRVLIQSAFAGGVVLLLIYDVDVHPMTKGAIVGVAAAFGEMTLDAVYVGVVRPLLERIGASMHGRGK